MRHSSLLLLLALSCGPTTHMPGAKPGTTDFWRITSSDVSFGTCSDDKAFRDGFAPIPFTQDSFLIYRTASDGKTATSQACTQVRTSTCTDSDAGVVFDVAGAELTFARTSKSPIQNTVCSLQADETWTLTDLGSTCTVEVKNLLSLVDDPTDCERVETNFKLRSPNGLGIAGCVATFTLGGSWVPSQ